MLYVIDRGWNRLQLFYKLYIESTYICTLTINIILLVGIICTLTGYRHQQQEELDVHPCWKGIL